MFTRSMMKRQLEEENRRSYKSSVRPMLYIEYLRKSSPLPSEVKNDLVVQSLLKRDYTGKLKFKQPQGHYPTDDWLDNHKPEDWDWEVFLVDTIKVCFILFIYFIYI